MSRGFIHPQVSSHRGFISALHLCRDSTDRDPNSPSKDMRDDPRSGRQNRKGGVGMGLDRVIEPNQTCWECPVCHERLYGVRGKDNVLIQQVLDHTCRPPDPLDKDMMVIGWFGFIIISALSILVIGVFVTCC